MWFILKLKTPFSKANIINLCFLHINETVPTDIELILLYFMCENTSLICAKAWCGLGLLRWPEVHKYLS